MWWEKRQDKFFPASSRSGRQFVQNQLVMGIFTPEMKIKNAKSSGTFHHFGCSFNVAPWRCDTPLKFNIDTQNSHVWKENIFQTIIFGIYIIYVRFRGCKYVHILMRKNMFTKNGWTNKVGKTQHVEKKCSTHQIGTFTLGCHPYQS